MLWWWMPIVPAGPSEQDALLLEVALVGSDVGAGEDLRGAHPGGGVLREVEDFQEVELRTEDVIRVLMPTLRRHGALDAMVAGNHRQADAGAQQGPQRARELRIQQHVLG